MSEKVQVWLDEVDFWPMMVVATDPKAVGQENLPAAAFCFEVDPALVGEYRAVKERFLELNHQFEAMIDAREAEGLARQLALDKAEGRSSLGVEGPLGRDREVAPGSLW